MLTKEPWIVHLAALRVCLLHVFAAIFIIFLLLAGFSNKIYHLVALPLLQQMPKGEHIIATTIVSPFFAPIKLTLFIALFIAMPYIIWRIWCYVSPALYKTEQRFSIILLSSALPIFYAGVAINYFLVAPRVFSFFIHHTPKGVVMMVDIHHYINFMLSLSLATGLVMQTPIVILLLVKSGLMSLEGLKNKRKYIFVGSFVIAMIIVPPEVLTQVIAALVIYSLFELGMLMVNLLIN